MHIRGLLLGGALLLTAASVAAPQGLFPVAMPFMCALLSLRYRAVYWARDEQDARMSSLIMDAIMAIVFICSVGRWTAGPWLIMAGFAANHAVILANGCAMPILGSPDLPPCYVRIGPTTRLSWLGDIYITEGGRPHRALFSIGDAVITVGLWVFTAELALMRCLRI